MLVTQQQGHNTAHVSHAHLSTNMLHSAATAPCVLPTSSSPPVGESRRCACRGRAMAPGAALAARLCSRRLCTSSRGPCAYRQHTALAREPGMHEMASHVKGKMNCLCSRRVQAGRLQRPQTPCTLIHFINCGCELLLQWMNMSVCLPAWGCPAA